MRFVLLVLFVSIALQAKEATCYTVQLLSAPSSKENSQKLVNLEYGEECKVMEIGNALTLRCGCYTSIKPAKEKLETYKQAYKYAYVATTYAYRFASQENVAVEKSVETQEPLLSLKEERLKLMLQSFLYSSDIKNAYKTAKIGIKQYPNHVYWVEKMAELAEWNGKEIEAVKYLNLLNKKKPSKKIETKLIHKGIGTYQFEEITDLVEKRAREFPSLKNDKQLVYVYYQIGNPEKAAHFFEREYKRKPRKTHYLTEALEVYMEMGDLESAKRIIAIIERRHLHNLENGKLMAYYYYLKHKMQKSYAVIEKIQNSNDDKKYYQLKSDVGWYLKRYQAAGDASERLIEHEQGRLVDYERVMYVNKGKDDRKVLQMALAAYEKFHESHLFYTYANKAMEQKQYKALENVINAIEKNPSSTLKQEANYWLVKANVYAYFHKSVQAERAIAKALSLDPESIEIQLQAIALYIEYHKQQKLKSALTHLSENSALPVAFYYPLASAYYQLQDSNRALFYLDKLLQMQASITKTLGFKFLQADIYAQRNNLNAYKQILYKIAQNLQQQKEKKPAIVQTDAFQYQYLRVQMHLMDPDTFEQKLKAAKAVLTQEHYDDLSYTWATKNGAKEKAHAIYEHIETKALWLKFANAMQEHNHSELENLLLKYLHSLAFLDASGVAKRDGQIALAQDLAFQALAKNSESQDAYIAHKNLSQERSNRFESKIAYYNRDPLLRKYVELKNETYVNHGYSIISEMNYYRNSSLDYNRLLYVPNATLELNMGVKKLFNRGELGAKIGYTDSMTTYGALEVFAKYQYTKLLKLYTSYAKNKKAQETTQLLIAGKKDMFSLGAKLDILASTSVNFLWQNNRFNSQDGVHLGDGNYARVLVGHQIRNGYPDMRIGVFGDYGKYSETQGRKGTIDKVQTAGNVVLPKEFYNLGFDFAYGMANSALYTRVWRPFAQINTFYNSEVGALSYNVNVGYGGKLFSQDHMVVGANYTESVNGVGGSIFELFLRYQFLYMQAAMLVPHHP